MRIFLINLILIAIFSNLEANRVNITKDLPFVDLNIDGKKFRIERIQDTNNKLKNDYTKTSRPTPPFFIQPFSVAKGVKTVGELDLISFLQHELREKKGLLIDARLPKWYKNGTIPFAKNIPFSIFYSKKRASKIIEIFKILDIEFKNKKFDFKDAKKLLIFDNGPWCAQASYLIKALIKLGYPKDKILYYRGGMQFWQIVGLNVIIPKEDNSKLSKITNDFLKDILYENRVINLSGKQRMLTQKIAKNAIALSFDKDAKSDLIASMKLYDKTLNGLLNGDSDLLLKKESNAILIKKIKDLKKSWDIFKNELDSLKNNKGDIQAIIDENLIMLDLSNELVQLYKKEFGQNYIQKARSNIVDLAGRERMLLQKMAKEKFLVELNIDKEKNQKNLQKSIELFESSLDILIDGSSKNKIPKTSNRDLLKRYKSIRRDFQLFKENLNKQNLNISDLKAINKTSNTLLKRMNESVKIAEELREY